MIEFIGRGSWIRTNDLQYPKLPRYQAALYPDLALVDTRSRRPQQGSRAPRMAGRATTPGGRASDQLVGRHPGTRLRMNLGGHHALGPRSETHQHILAGTQLGHAEAAQRLHVHEDIRRSLAASEKTETA